MDPCERGPRAVPRGCSTAAASPAGPRALWLLHTTPKCLYPPFRSFSTQYLLAQHPEAEARACAELEELGLLATPQVGGGAATSFSSACMPRQPGP